MTGLIIKLFCCLAAYIPWSFNNNPLQYNKLIKVIKGFCVLFNVNMWHWSQHSDKVNPPFNNTLVFYEQKVINLFISPFCHCICHPHQTYRFNVSDSKDNFYFKEIMFTLRFWKIETNSVHKSVVLHHDGFLLLNLHQCLGHVHSIRGEVGGR